MNKAVTAHSPALAVGTPRRSLRSLVAVLLIAMASLGATIGYIATDDAGTSTVANTQSSPSLGDPLQARTQPVRPLGGPSERRGRRGRRSARRRGAGARFQALQDKLDSMTPQQKAAAFSR